jgi:ABC-type dipeptide/oligopeptide/nickel transport system permease component
LNAAAEREWTVRYLAKRILLYAYAIAVLTANLCVDLLYAWLDPRIHYA